ncbi:MAG: adenylate/guanylate cyclase domain-containing protein [Mycobacterium sp.]
MNLPISPTIDELLDQAVNALNSGDRETADALAGRVLAVDSSNLDAEELLSTSDGQGEIRRLTMLFADLVDSTALSARIEPEVYWTVVGRYREEVLKIIGRYEGHVYSTKGDGLLAVFGHPIAHENDAHRAVQAGLDITREVAALSEKVRQRFGFEIAVRVGTHRGLVYLDKKGDDVYGLGANLAARICSLAEPGTVAISTAIQRVVRHDFELEALPPQPVKGIDGLIEYYRVVAENDATSVVRGPLVGRHRELSYLKDSWAQAMAGTLTTPGLLLLGEGGIGKSRLAGAAVKMAEDSGAPVLALVGSPFHTHVGLRPVRRLMERISGIARGSDPAERLSKLEASIDQQSMDSSTLIPLLAPVLGLGPPTGYQPTTANAGRLYEQIAGAVKDYLLAHLGTGPGLLLIEDIHWFDEDTIEVVQSVINEEHGQLLIVITGRQLPPLEGSLRIFNLKPLDAGAADELILTLHPELNAKARNAVLQRCDGIPLYIEEVVAKIKERQGDSGESTQVPDTLYETLVARLQPSTNALRIVEVAALIGSRVDPRLLASVVELDQREVDDLFEELTRGRVLRQVGEHSWRFHHELLREVAAELSPPSVRQRLHSRIADALVEAAAEGVPEWPLVAHHHQRAGRFDEAASAYRHAAANARQRGALGEARAHLARALESIDGLPPSRARDQHEVAVRLERGFLASAATGHASAEAAAEFERCLQLIGDRPGPELYATLSALWSYYATRGDLARATQVVEALRSRLSDMPDWYRAATEAVTGSLHVFRGEFDSARKTLESAAVAVSELQSTEIDGAWYAPNDPVAGMYTFVGFVRYIQGDMAGATTAFAQMESRCDAMPFPHGPFTRCYGKTLEALVRTEAGQRDRAIQLVSEVAALGQQYGFDEWVMISASEAANTFAKGSIATGRPGPEDLAAHVEALTTVVEGWRAGDLISFLCWYDAALALTLLAAGRRTEASHRVDLALSMADETGWHIYDAELIRIRAHTRESVSERISDLLEASKIAQSQGALVFEMRSAADLFKATGGSGRATLVDVLSRFPAEQDWPELASARSLLS